MKKLLYSILAVAGAAFMFASCQQETYDPCITPVDDIEVPVLSDHEDIVINGDNIGSELVSFVCSEVDFGQPVTATYSLYFTYTPEGGEAKEALVGTSNSHILNFDKGTVNSAVVNGLGIEANSAADISAYVVVTLAHVQLEKSNVITFNVQTYKALFNHLFLVGSFQGWSIDNALPFWEEVAGSGIYKTTVEFADDATGFKIPDNRAWDGTERGFDWFSTKSEGVTASDDGNLVMNKGIWTLTVDLNVKSFQATAVEAMILKGSWSADWSEPIALKYDTATGAWKSETAVDGGTEFKVCLDNEWKTSYGSDASEAENLGEFDTVTGGFNLVGNDNVVVPAGGKQYILVHADRTPWVVSYEAAE